MAQISDIILLIAGVATVAFIYVLLVLRTRSKPRVPTDTKAVPPNAIIVDGSNVMHWGGEPSQKVLVGVLANLVVKGLTPVVVFDASVGYRLRGKYVHGPAMADMIGLPSTNVYVAQKGVVADEVILDLAQTHGLKVVSNDRYRDWSVRFPFVKKKGRMVRGVWKGGNIVWAKR